MKNYNTFFFSEPRMISKNWPGKFRLVGTVALALAFFLPVSSCSSIVTVDQENTQVVRVDADSGYRYPFKELAFNNPKSALIALAYFWPAAALMYRKLSRNMTGRKFTALELLLCILSIYVVSTLAFLERMEIGSYLAFAGVALYVIAAATIFTNDSRRAFSSQEQ